MMNVMPESIRTRLIRRVTTVLYTNDRYNRSITCYIYNLNLNVYAHIFQGYLRSFFIKKDNNK